jgi:hypothetical protein
MSYEFQDSAPVKIQGTGRKAEPNPFTDVIKAIALKTTKVDGKDTPVAKSFTEKHEDGARDKTVARIKRLLSEAGAANDPAVTVPSAATPVQVKGKDSNTETVITFWTVKRQVRTRKPADPTAPATASTEQSAAVASA